MIKDSLSLDNKNIIITGVSRPQGIGNGITKTFLESGTHVAIHGYSPYDLELNYAEASSSNEIKLMKELAIK